ncbi:MAG: diaminopimelate epimerase [Chitinophagales bacterium]|nr:diaminopimelate epimerase [Chitinophagales bacterium]
MSVEFQKYHGAGNDFVMIDDRDAKFNFSKEQIAQICHRRYGIGAYGLILIRRKEGFDFEMLYYNADGGIGSMCGNGGRCAAMFAKKLGINKEEMNFNAFDGAHHALFVNNEIIKLSMAAVSETENFQNDFILNTGSPHYIKFVDDVNSIDVVREGKKIRYSEKFIAEGINVNFVTIKHDVIEMRTYERGVEDETLSCGTGTVAVAIATSVKLNNKTEKQQFNLKAPGGNLKVYFSRKEDCFKDVWLEGSVEHVYSGNFHFSQ